MADSKAPPQAAPLSPRPGAVDGLPRGVVFDRGFRLLGSAIGFGGAGHASLHFFSNLDDAAPQRAETVLVTPFMAAAMGADKRGLDVLALDYHRKLRFGQMDIRLVPAGMGPGSAQYEVVFKSRRILFSNGVRLAQPLLFQPAELPGCDILLLDVKPAEPRPPSPKRVSGQLKRWVVETIAAGQVPVIALGSLGAAFDAAWTLAFLDVEIRACRTVFEMFKRVETIGFKVPGLKRLEQAWPGQAVVLHLARLWPQSGFFGQPGKQVAFAGPGRGVPEWADAGFRLGEGEDRPGLVTYVNKVGAAEVALGPSCDQALSDLLCKAGIRVYRLPRTQQMPLPFF